MNSETIVRAVGRHLNLRQGLLIPQATVAYKTGQVSSFSGYEYTANYLADLMWVTGSNYATEIEIKISRADWRIDADKRKWSGLPSYISRFVYVVPEELGVPEFVLPFAGVWHVRQSGHRAGTIHVARTPRRLGKEKVGEPVINYWLRNLYFRYWYQKLYKDERFNEFERKEAA